MCEGNTVEGSLTDSTISATMPSEQAPLLSARPRLSSVRVILLITAWYLSSSVAIILTKSLFSGTSRRLAPFPFALTVTATNNVVASTVATVLLGPPPESVRDSNVQRLALFIGATTAAEIGLSNIALNLLSVSYSTVLKGMAPFFVMAWGVLLGLQRLQLSLLATMIAIGAGLALAVIGEKDSKSLLQHIFEAGFVAQMVSGVLSGFRWILTQVFVKGETITNERLSSALNIRPIPRGLSTMETIRMTAPYTLLWVLPFVVVIEGRDLVKWIGNASLMDILNLITVLTIIGVCVYALLWAEYELVKVTSSLTVSVGFVLKEALVIFAGKIVFKDRLSVLTCTGFAIVQSGILGYAYLRKRQMETLLRNSSSG